jgi:hypothetical protein
MSQDRVESFNLRGTIRRNPDTGDLVVGGNPRWEVVYPKGSAPSNWGEAVMFRAANQGNLPNNGGRFPLSGSGRPPAVRGGGPAPAQ